MTTTEQAIAEIWQLFKKTDERLDKRFKETDERLDKRFKETDQEIKELGKRINQITGHFDNQWGRMVEALIRSDVVRLFQERGIAINAVSSRFKREIGNETMEIDLLLLNERELVALEAKSVVKTQDVADFLTDLAAFKRFFREYRDYRVYGAMAGLEILQEAGRYAYRQGLFVLEVQGEGLVKIRNDKKFRPVDFGAQKKH